MLARLEICDPQHVRALSVLSLLEQQQERLPVLLANSVLAFDNLPWSATFSVQAQLKRMADLLLATVLLLTAPFVFLAALFIWLDQGPVLYAQQRSGWLGRPFTAKTAYDEGAVSRAPARWTEPDDQRITLVGGWLRRVR